MRGADPVNGYNAITREIHDLWKLPTTTGDSRLERIVRMRAAVRDVPFLWLIRFIVWLHKNIPSLHIRNRGGAVLVSSPSKYGVDAVVAHWPNTIGISYGLIKERPWVVDGALAIRNTSILTLAFDRRIISGAEAARFMRRLSELLERAEAAWFEAAPASNTETEIKQVG